MTEESHPSQWSYWAGKTMHYLPHAISQAAARGLELTKELPERGRVVLQNEDRNNPNWTAYRLEFKDAERRTVHLVTTMHGNVITVFQPQNCVRWHDRSANPHTAAKEQRAFQRYQRKSQVRQMRDSSRKQG